MALEVPSEATYVYEHTPRWTALYLWIPTNAMRDFVPRGRVQQLKKDYPDGLQVEIEGVELKRFNETYGLDIKRDADDLLKAFAVLRQQKSLPHSGYIPLAALDRFAEALAASLVKEGYLDAQKRVVAPTSRSATKTKRHAMDWRRRKERAAIRASLDKNAVGGALRDCQRQVDPEPRQLETKGNERPRSALIRIATQHRRRSR